MEKMIKSMEESIKSMEKVFYFFKENTKVEFDKMISKLNKPNAKLIKI